MKQIKYLIVIVCCMLGSCKKDFLEVVDKTVLVKEGYVVDLETTGHFMNGVYTDLAYNYVTGTYLPYPEIQADNMKPSSGSNYFSMAYNWTFSPRQDGEFGDPIYMWKKYYGIIRSCNYVLEKATEYKDQDVAKANNMMGQALVIRALIHFNLVNMFAQSYNYTADASHPGIPYIKSSDIDQAISRQTVSEVYKAMIDDLLMALQLLPSNFSSRQLMNYQAAKALLSRVYLFKEDFVNAKNISREVLQTVPIMTANYPSKLYSLDDTEAIFWMPPGDSFVDNYYAAFIGFYAEGYQQYLATSDVAQILREDLNDKRSAWVTLSSSGDWVITKFPKNVTGGTQFPLPEGDYYQTLFRSSEICLNASEAYAKLNMEDSARFYIDAIRQRANPALLDITATGSALLDTIYKERRKEMCFDGMRMWDLQRWKKEVVRLDANNPNAQTLPYPNNKSISAIPLTDVAVAGLQQNPGY